MSWQRCYIAMFVSVLVCGVGDASRAAFTFLGPTPYLSAADSPFPVVGNPNFFLEDFEDGEINTPAVLLPSNPNARGHIVPSGQPLTNSVDADDGILDGMGRAGRAWMSSVYTTNLVDPPTSSSYISFSFDAAQLGFLPNAIGFAWTYGRPNSTVRLDVFDQYAVNIGYVTFPGIGNGIDNDSADDRFFGVLGSESIGGVLITSSYAGEPWVFEIDHVQYGLLVPETRTISLLLIGTLSIFMRKHSFRGHE